MCRLKAKVILVLHQPVIGGLKPTLDRMPTDLEYLSSVHSLKQVKQQEHSILGDLQHGAKFYV